MNPQDTVEHVLKDIHIAFSRAEIYNGQPDKVVMDRREFMELLDRLTKGIYDMLDKYEQTRQSRDLAERAFKRKGDEIIDQANTSADDIYAASIIYTAETLGRIRDLMDQTNESMNDLFREFRKNLREEKNQLQKNETDLQAQLADLSDSQKYLNIIRDLDKERRRKNRDLEAEKAAGENYRKNMFYTAVGTAGIKVNEQAAAKEKAEKKGEPQAVTDTPEIRVNTDAEYFKWKAAKEQKEKKAEEADVSAPEDTEAAIPAESGQDEPEMTGKTTEAEGPKRSVARSAAEEEDPIEAPQEELPPGRRPTEEEIRRAVMEDERADILREARREEMANVKKKAGKKSLKDIFLGN